MRQCPVCDSKTESMICRVCGFDASRDYENAPTLVPTMSIAARRKAWQERQEALGQELQWQTEREQTRASLATAERRCSQLEQKNRELKRQLTNALTQVEKSTAENAELKAGYEEKLTAAQVAAELAEQRAAEAAQAQQEPDAPIRNPRPHQRPEMYGKVRLRERYSDFIKNLFQPLEDSIAKKLEAETDGHFWDLTPAPDADLRAFRRHKLQLRILWFIQSLIIKAPIRLVQLYLILTLCHFALFHAPWSSAPCRTRPSCPIYICAPEKDHQWNDPTCFEPKTCTVCGEITGGTDGHIWNSDECTLCGVRPGQASFAYVTTAEASIRSGLLEGDGLTNVLTFTDESLFPNYGVSVRDAMGRTTGAQVKMDDNSIRITFPQSLSDGSYHICNRQGDQLLATYYYCRAGTPFPHEAVESTVPFQAENLLTGQHLQQEGDGYRTAAEPSDPMDPDSAPGTLVALYYITPEENWITLYGFRSGGRWLAANSNGTVYWTTDLTGECCWLIKEESK